MRTAAKTERPRVKSRDEAPCACVVIADLELLAQLQQVHLGDANEFVKVAFDTFAKALPQLDFSPQVALSLITTSAIAMQSKLPFGQW